MMQVVQQQLRRAGITLDLQVVEHATFHQQIRQDLSPLVYYSAARFPVADIYLSQFFHGRSIVKTPTAVTNFSHCNQADAQIDAARSAPTRRSSSSSGPRRSDPCAAGLRGATGRDAAGFRPARHPGLRLHAEVGSMGLGPLITEQTRLR